MTKMSSKKFVDLKDTRVKVEDSQDLQGKNGGFKGPKKPKSWT